MSDLHEVSEAELIRLAAAGDADVFGELYERHAQSVYRFLCAHLDNPHDAEDLMEDVFLRAWQTLPSYREKGVPFIAFLFRIARNGLVDFYRSSKASKRLTSIDDLPLPDHNPEPGESLLANLERQEVHALLGKLREDYRVVLVLRFLSDLSPEETAQVMGRSPGSVRVLQHRALLAMRQLLEGRDG